MQMDVDKDPLDSHSTRHPPLLSARSPSPQSLSSSEPLRRVQPPPMSRVESPRPASPPRQTSSVPGPLPDAEPPPAHSSPRTDASSPPPSSPQATPKVKMSLKDFAMRKKKQREEEQARAAVLPSDSLPPSGQSGASAAVDPPSSDAARDPNGCEHAARDVAAPRVATENNTSRSDCDVESTDLSSGPTSHPESESSASTKAGIVRAASPGNGHPLPDAATWRVRRFPYIRARSLSVLLQLLLPPPPPPRGSRLAMLSRTACRRRLPTAPDPPTSHRPYQHPCARSRVGRAPFARE